MKQESHYFSGGSVNRDNIPEIIKASGKECDVSILNDEEYILKLKEKIVEEAHEVVSAREDEIISELADVLEIIEAINNNYVDKFYNSMKL